MVAVRDHFMCSDARVPLTAYIDESARRRQGETVCFYVLSAVLVDDSEVDDVRANLRSLRYGKTNIIHWRHERPERWPMLATAISVMPIKAIVAVCPHASATSSERARRFCLSRLLVEFREAGADRVVLDSRQGQDAAELRMVMAWRRARRPEAHIRLDYVRSSEEPMLWVTDCVAGAVAWWLGGDSVGWDALEPVVRLVEVELP